MRDKVLQKLSEADDYISGQDLCEQLGVSRTAVWKAVNRLKEDGYDILSVPNKGYKLAGRSEVYSEYEIRSRLKTQALASEVVFYEQTGSTNNDCKRLMQEAIANPERSILVAAANQEGGKGRRGRAWTSPAGSSISFSLGLVPRTSLRSASMLTLVMALAVVRAINEVTGLKAGIKWPNDIVIDGRKVCGILTEMNLEEGEIASLVIGVGINVSQTDFDEEIKDTATSLLLELQRSGEPSQEGSISRSAITAECVNQFEKLYDTFCIRQDLSELKEEYEKVLVNKGRVVRVLDPKGEYEATSLGITDDGELMVKTGDGQIRNVYAGEVSVRGIYGYT
ncbi:MAG: biotin--[acetyl-CoA-carboxylase] ligase [Lachnospiraceae bacterium]|nr:biotin--[acetyl-CoA-carboxylase] ligase [Lachnospiraceae bacterium]